MTPSIAWALTPAEVAKLLPGEEAAAGDRFGYSVSVSENTAVIGAPDDDENGNDAGAAFVYLRSNGVWTKQTKLLASDGAVSDRFGLSVSISGDTVVIGSYQDDDNGPNSGSAYVYTPDASGTWKEVTKLLPSDGEETDLFGWSVSISGSTVIVGAYRDDDNGANSGSAYIFSRASDGTWSEQTKLIAGDGGPNSAYGYSVSASGSTTVVGAYSDFHGVASGSAYVYVRDAGGAWNQQAKLTPNDGAPGDRFGASVSVSDDTVVIGAEDDDDNAGGSGSAYVYVRDVNGSWGQQAKLTASDAASSDQFGRSVSVSEDTALIAALYDDDNGSNSGSAYIYVRDTNGTWEEQTKITASDGTSGREFGMSVALSGNTALLGSLDDDNGSDAGSTYVFTGSGLAWNEEQKLASSDGADQDNFGYSVSISGNTALIGSPLDDDNGTDSGSAYVYVESGGQWTQQAKLVASDGSAFARFGWSVAVNHDTVIVGAYQDQGDNGDFPGAAYVFTRTGSNWSEQQKLTATDGIVSGDGFGWSVAIDGDTSLIGAQTDDPSGTNSGSVYVFARSGNVWSEQAKLTASDGHDFANFGYSVSLLGNVASIGAPTDDESGENSGAAYLFTRSGVAWTERTKLKLASGTDFSQFGRSVSLYGDTLVVGAPEDDGANDPAAGAAYVYTGGGASWNQQARLTASDGVTSEGFGTSVAVYGDAVIIGADNDGTAGPNAGSSYVYTRTGTSWVEQQELTAADLRDGSFFGFSVAVEDDSALIGAFDTDENGGASGSAYVFSLSGTPTAEAQAVSIMEDTASGVSLGGSDPNGDPLVYSVETNPTNGTLSGAAPDLTYTPDSDYNGQDSFTFTVSDATNTSDPATVDIAVTPVNDAPTATGQTVSTLEDTALDVMLSGTDVDGDTLSVVIDTNPATGVLSGTAPDITYTPNANFNGLDSFKFIVNDGTVDSDPATIEITVTAQNDVPTAIGQNVATAEDTALPITLSGTDPEGDSLTFVVDTHPEHGTVSGSSPNVTYIPDANFNGVDSFTFVANDGHLDSPAETVSINVTPVNDLPIANGQNLSTDEDTVLDITLTGSDVEGSPLTFIIESNPDNGTLTDTRPDVTYTPNANFNGADSFTFVAHDGTDRGPPATVNITVGGTNDAPTADDQNVSTNEDTALPITLTGADLDGDALSFSVATQPVNGILSGTPPNVTYTPNADFHGSDSFTFAANDGTVDSIPATVDITVDPINDPPVANGDSVATLEDTPTAITLTGSDVDGDVLSFSVTTQPSNGILSGTGASVTYTPNPDFNGSDSFTFVANDGTVDSAPAVIDINVSAGNDEPAANGQNVVTDEDTSVSITLTGSDPDGDSLSFAIDNNPANGTLSGAPPNVTYTPNADFNGADSFTFFVNDGLVDSDPATVDITVDPINDAPTAVAQALSTNEGVPLDIALAGSDIDGDPLSFFVETGPANGTLSGSPPDLTYTPDVDFSGDDAFTYVANDGVEDSAPATVDITVVADPTAAICGTPTYDKSIDRGTFVWSPCDGTHRISIRVTGGGTPTVIEYLGRVSTPGGVQNLGQVSVESTDIVDTSVADQLSYDLDISNVGQDGLDFNVNGAAACIEFLAPPNLPVYLGANRTMWPFATLDLIQGGECVITQPVTSWLNHVGGVTTNQGQIDYSGIPVGWDNNTVNSSVLSLLGHTDDYEIRWRIDSDPANTSWAVGLGETETASHWTDIDYALRSNNGALEVYESGVLLSSGPVLQVGDVVSIYVNAGLMEYRLNGAVIHTSSYAGSPAFYIDTSFDSGAMSLNVSAAPPATPPGNALIGDYVWNDADGDGIQDGNEFGQPGVTVQLQDCGGNGLLSTTSDANGAYEFSGLLAGDYQVRFIAPNGFILSPPEQGNKGGQDSNPDPATGLTNCLVTSANKVRRGIDAGLIPQAAGSAEIGDRVWSDSDGDGIQDAGERGLAGATIRLRDCSGNLITETVSDAAGAYLFGGLAAGSYQLEFLTPAGFTRSPAKQGNKGGQDSDPNAQTGLTSCQNMSEGQSRLGIDAGMVPQAGGSGQIGDRVWHDLDGDGIQDNGEPGLGDVAVNLLDCSGNVLMTTLTSGNGTYGFSNLAAASYQVEFVPAAGFVLSPQQQGNKGGKDSDPNPNTGVTTCKALGEGQTRLGIDAGMVGQPSGGTGVIGDYVWLDSDGDGHQDNSEPGLADVQVELQDCGGSVLSTAATDAGGVYQFSGLAAASYRIRFIAPAGLNFTGQGQSTGGKDSDPNPNTGVTACKPLADGQSRLGIDAGLN